MLSRLIGTKTTLGREIALVLVGIYVYSIIQGDPEIVKVIVWPTVTYVAAVVGLNLNSLRMRE